MQRGIEKTTTIMAKKMTGGSPSGNDNSFSQEFDARIEKLNDWRGKMLVRIRKLVKQADPEIIEEVKWRKPTNPAGVSAWSHEGLVCTGETYKSVVKVTFAKGAQLEDPAELFNASLDGNARRAIDIHEGDKIDEQALKTLIRAAVKLNTGAPMAARPRRSAKKPKRA